MLFAKNTCTFYIIPTSIVLHELCDNVEQFSKSVLDIKTRLVVTVELGTKWMPNSDSASNFIPEYKFLGY